MPTGSLCRQQSAMPPHAANWRLLPEDHPLRQDRSTEEAVLAHVIHEYPIHLTREELLRALGVALASDDAINRAIGELIGMGLLHVYGQFIVPTRAALHCWELT
jgi:hypothetical protein